MDIMKKGCFAIYDGEVLWEDHDEQDPEILVLFEELASVGHWTAQQYGTGLWVCSVDYSFDGEIGLRSPPRWEEGRVVSGSELVRLRGVDASVRTIGRTIAQGMAEA